MSIDTQPQEKTPKEWLDALRVGKIWNEKTPRCSPPTFAADGTFAKGCAKQTKRPHTASFFISFFTFAAMSFGLQNGQFSRAAPRCAAARAPLRTQPAQKCADGLENSRNLYVRSACLSSFTAYSSSRSHRCASERGATRRRTSARDGRKPAAFLRRLRGRCSPRAAGAGFRR